MNTTPIEFMAWDKNKNSFRSTFELSMMDLVNSKNIEFMQLTALRSINDEPIYNHMIVKDEFGYYFVVNMFKYLMMYDLGSRDLEIVGNRFQNPELLALCK